MSKYHVNPKTGNPGLCTAKNQCPFGDSSEHFDSKAEARQSYSNSMEATTALSSPKRRAQRPKAPRYPYSSLDASSHVAEFDYDSYGPPNGHCDCETICRCHEYSGLRVSSVDTSQLENALKSAVGIPDNEPISPELSLELTTHLQEWSDTENYDAYSSRGYYGDEAQVDYPSSFVVVVKKYRTQQWKRYNQQLTKLGYPKQDIPAL
jgi:hypothetical protein